MFGIAVQARGAETVAASGDPLEGRVPLACCRRDFEEVLVVASVLAVDVPERAAALPALCAVPLAHDGAVF